MIPRILETDKWTAGRNKIEEEIENRMDGLLRVKTLDDLSYHRGYIEALKWAIETVDPPKRRDLETEDE